MSTPDNRDSILRGQNSSDRRKEAVRATALSAIEVAGSAVGVPHIAALKALISGPNPDSLVSLANQAQGFAAREMQPDFEQLSSKLTNVTDITSPTEKAGGKILDAVTPIEKPLQETERKQASSVPGTEKSPAEQAAEKRRAEYARLEAAKREFERITWELEAIGARVRSVTSSDVARYDLDNSESDVKTAQARFESIMREQLPRAAQVFHQTVMELYADYPQQKGEAQEKLQAQYHRLDEEYRKLELAFDAVERSFTEARSS